MIDKEKQDKSYAKDFLDEWHKISPPLGTKKNPHDVKAKNRIKRKLVKKIKKATIKRRKK